jgi:hypothetical protein
MGDKKVVGRTKSNLHSMSVPHWIPKSLSYLQFTTGFSSSEKALQALNYEVVVKLGRCLKGKDRSSPRQVFQAALCTRFTRGVQLQRTCPCVGCQRV